MQSRRNTTDGEFINTAAGTDRTADSDPTDGRQTKDSSNATTITGSNASTPLTYTTEYASLTSESVTVHTPAPPYHGKDVRVKSATGSVITLLDVYGAVRLQHLTNCTVYIGSVLGPLYVEDVKGCKVFARSRQLRIHDTYATDFYVWTSSGPIIEDCNGLR